MPTEALDTALQLSISPSDRNGKAKITVTLGGHVLHVDEVVLAQATDRARFATELTARNPGIDKEGVEAQLLEWAGASAHREHRPQRESYDEDDDQPISSCPWPAPPHALAYHGLAGEIALAVEPHTEADPIAILMQLLVAFGCAVGRGAYAIVGATRHFCNECVVIVGASSVSRKGTSWDEAERFIKSADAQFAQRILGGMSSGEGLIFAVRDPVYGKEPIKEGRNITGYRDVITDHGEEDKRLLAHESEFGRQLKVMGREHNILSAVIRQAFDGKDLRNLTKAAYHATDAHISIAAHITSFELKSLLSHVDAVNGVANRFLWVAAKRTKLLAFGGNLDPEDFGGYCLRLAAALEFAKKVGHVHWTRKAMRVWKEHYPILSRERPGVLGAILNRAETHVLRLAMINALLDRRSSIEPPHLQAALAVWDYAERSATYIFGDSLGSPDAEKILEALRANPTGLKRSQLTVDVFKKNIGKARMDVALTLLLDSKVIRQERVETEGRPAWRYVINEGNEQSPLNGAP
jgi:hypothetical protein